MCRACFRVVGWSTDSVFAVTEVGFCLSSGLFDSSGVVVLVAGKGCAAGECLLAVGVGTLVRSFARMDPAMPG